MCLFQLEPWAAWPPPPRPQGQRGLTTDPMRGTTAAISPQETARLHSGLLSSLFCSPGLGSAPFPSSLLLDLV